jgi:hypothetical protein
MLTKTTIALVAALVAGTASVASASEWSSANRQGYNHAATQGTYRTAPVRLQNDGADRAQTDQTPVYPQSLPSIGGN